MTSLNDVLSRDLKPALLVGNGINIHGGANTSNWNELLEKLANSHGLSLTKLEREEMSNTEFFDILDLAKPQENRQTLQSDFCELMQDWRPEEHHGRIANWAKRHERPIVTVNFDENLSKSIKAKFYRAPSGFTDFYPWSSYFSDRKVAKPCDEFAIWHAHGVVRYKRSIRLGLTHYMGAVQRARSWFYSGNDSLREKRSTGCVGWRGADTWLHILLFSPVLIFGFGFGKEENLMRWLFLERARLQKIWSIPCHPVWFVEKENQSSSNRKAFFERLGINFIGVDAYEKIYEAEGWAL